MGKPHVSHPSEKTLHAFGLGKLDDASSAAVGKHVDQCPECRRRLGEVSPDDFLKRLRRAQDGDESSPGNVPLPPKVTRLSAPPPELMGHPDYEIVGELGRGGMGVVYLAHIKIMNRHEVFKVVNRDIMSHSGALDRFLQEIRSAARLNHANIVAAYAAYRFGKLLVFAMEYVEGQDLAKEVHAHGQMPVGFACFCTQQAALGLQHAHERGMVHRDIKPSNLMLSLEGTRPLVKIMDFGLAKATSEKSLEMAQAEAKGGKAFDAGLTGAGKMLGTPDYMAPEQTLDAQKADTRADIYSLGCTLYYLLSGGVPFQSKSLAELLEAHHRVDARLLNLARPEVPAELAGVVAKMMAKGLGRRYQTPAEVLAALAPFVKREDARRREVSHARSLSVVPIADRETSRSTPNVPRAIEVVPARDTIAPAPSAKALSPTRETQIPPPPKMPAVDFEALFLAEISSEKKTSAPRTITKRVSSATSDEQRGIAALRQNAIVVSRPIAKPIGDVRVLAAIWFGSTSCILLCAISLNVRLYILGLTTLGIGLAGLATQFTSYRSSKGIAGFVLGASALNWALAGELGLVYVRYPYQRLSPIVEVVLSYPWLTAIVAICALSLLVLAFKWYYERFANGAVPKNRSPFDQTQNPVSTR